MTRKYLIAATLLLSTATASAETDAERDLYYALRDYAYDIEVYKKDFFGRPGRDVKHCYGAIATARAANVSPSYEMYESYFEHVKGAQHTANGYRITAGQANLVCDGFKPYWLLKQAHTLIVEAHTALRGLELGREEDLYEGMGARLLVKAKECSDGLARLTKEGVKTDHVMEIGASRQPVNTTVAKAKTEICQTLAAKAASIDSDLAADRVAAEKEHKEQRMKPFRDAGITGDRLDVLLSSDGSWYGVGQRQFDSVAQMKKPSVLFKLVEDRDRVVTVTRYQFKGDKLIKETSKQYFLRPGPKEFR